jgi:hypothetical protein
MYLNKFHPNVAFPMLTSEFYAAATLPKMMSKL